MAGRAERQDRNDYLFFPDEDAHIRVQPPAVNSKFLIKKIDEITMNNIEPVLYEAEIMFKSLCVSQVAMRDVMLNLHCKALSDPKFGEKYVMVLGQVSTYVVDNVPLRSELLTLIENDFKIKDTMFQSDTIKFLNSVLLLGHVYNLFKIQGMPLRVLGGPMLDYMNLLLEGREEHHRVFAIQVLLNGEKIAETENLATRFDLLKQSVRRTLITRELNGKSKCWILLALDYMSNDFKPLNEEMKNFYLVSLGDDNVYVHSLLKNASAPERRPEISPNPTASLSKQCDDIFKDIENLTIPPEILNAVSTRIKPPKPLRFSLVPKVRFSKNNESKNGSESEDKESNSGNGDEDEVQGAEAETEKKKPPKK